MTKIGELAIHIVGDTKKLEQSTQRARRDVRGMASAITRTALPSLAAMATRAAAAGTALLGLSSAAGFATRGVRLAASAQATAKAFEVMVGSVEGAEKLLGQLKEMANTTPFLTREVIGAGRALAALARDGKDIENIPDSLRRLGDIAAALQLPLGELAILYGRAQSAGLLYTEDLNQFVDRGIALHKVLGMNLSEMKKMASQGKFTFEMLEQAIKGMTSEGGQFFQMTKIQSEQVIGRWSTIQSQIDELAKKFGTAVLPHIESLLTALTAILDKTTEIGRFWGDIAEAIQSAADGLKQLQQYLPGANSEKRMAENVADALQLIPGGAMVAEAVRMADRSGQAAVADHHAGAAFGGMFATDGQLSEVDTVGASLAEAAKAAKDSAEKAAAAAEAAAADDDPFAGIVADQSMSTDALRAADERGAAFLRDKFADVLRGLRGPELTAITGRNSAVMAGTAEAVALQNQQARMDVPQRQLRAQLDGNQWLREIAGGVGRLVAQPSLVVEGF